MNRRKLGNTFQTIGAEVVSPGAHVMHTPPLNRLKNLNSRSNPSWNRPAHTDMRRSHDRSKHVMLADRTLRTAPVSHQKRSGRSITNAIEIEQKLSKINKPDRHPPAHNGLVAGSSPAGPTSLRSRSE